MLKNKGLLIGGIVVLVILMIVGWFMGTYNGFVGLKANVDESWSQVQVQYQRRADLVPQLVATVSGAADFEKSTLTEVTEARTKWLNASQNSAIPREDQIAAANSFDSSLSRLLVTVESYPQLTATENFRTLQAQLEGTENRIAVARRDFNAAAKTYNVNISQVPRSILAGMFGFTKTAFFESAAGAEVAPTVDFKTQK